MVGPGHSPHHSCPAGTVQLGHRDRTRAAAVPVPATVPDRLVPHKAAPTFTDAYFHGLPPVWMDGITITLYKVQLRIRQYDAWPGMKEPPQDAGRYGSRLIEVIGKNKRKRR